MKTYAIMQLGCKVNDFEATYIREKMNEYFLEINFKDKADIYLIFTCAVTNTAEAKTRKFLHKAKSNNPNSYVVAIGCLSQIKGSTEAFKDVDLIIGSTKKDQIVDLILANTEGNVVEEKIIPKFEDMYIKSYPLKSRAFLKIQDGCNQYCNYCIIPYARGNERSANHINVLNQAIELSNSFKEIVLTGIHTGRYFDGEYNLYQLLYDLVKIDKLETIRLSSIEITEISDEIIDLIACSPKIAKHLHIPIQAASDEILKAMNRPYNLDNYIKRINYIRSKVKDISISTDLIVGYPGESDEIFNNSLKTLKDINFSFIHVFPYSRKTGTKADKLDNHIDPKIKKQRVNTVLEFEKPLTKSFKESFIDKEIEVLVEKNDCDYSYGYSKQYFYTKIKGKFDIGSIVKGRVKIVDNDEVLADAII